MLFSHHQHNLPNGCFQDLSRKILYTCPVSHIQAQEREWTDGHARAHARTHTHTQIIIQIYKEFAVLAS
jgi:hypothetical protein